MEVQMAIKPTDSQLADCACVFLASGDYGADSPTADQCLEVLCNLRVAFPMTRARFVDILGEVLYRYGLIDG